MNLTVIPSYKDVVVLVLNEPVIQIRPIDERKNIFQPAIKSHLLLKSSMSCFDRLLAGPRMTATRIRVQTSGMILAEGSALEQHASVRIKNEDGKRAV